MIKYLQYIVVVLVVCVFSVKANAYTPSNNFVNGRFVTTQNSPATVIDTSNSTLSNLTDKKGSFIKKQTLLIVKKKVFRLYKSQGDIDVKKAGRVSLLITLTAYLLVGLAIITVSGIIGFLALLAIIYSCTNSIFM